MPTSGAYLGGGMLAQASFIALSSLPAPLPTFDFVSNDTSPAAHRDFGALRRRRSNSRPRPPAALGPPIAAAASISPLPPPPTGSTLATPRPADGRGVRQHGPLEARGQGFAGVDDQGARSERRCRAALPPFLRRARARAPNRRPTPPWQVANDSASGGAALYNDFLQLHQQARGTRPPIGARAGRTSTPPTPRPRRAHAAHHRRARAHSSSPTI